MDLGSPAMGPLGRVGLALVGFAYGVVLPVGGIAMAALRRARGTRSIGAVAWSLINCGLFGVAAFTALRSGRPPVWLGIGFVLNGIWLNASVRSNRVVERRPDL